MIKFNLEPWLTEGDAMATAAIVQSGDLMSGRLVAELESKLAEYFGKRHAVCVSSGTAALEAAFHATGEGFELHPHGFVALISAQLGAGFDYPMADDKGVRTDVLGEHAEAITAVHDCAHRFDRGAAHAEVSCFSFAPNKFLAACGGVLVTNNSVVAASARQYRNHGRDGGPEVFGSGRNLRMGEINAALALSQFARIDQILARRKKVATWYDELFGLALAPTRESWFLYPVKCKDENHGLRSRADFRLFDSAVFADHRTALLPIFPNMDRADAESVANKIRPHLEK